MGGGVPQVDEFTSVVKMTELLNPAYSHRVVPQELLTAWPSDVGPPAGHASARHRDVVMLGAGAMSHCNLTT